MRFWRKKPRPLVLRGYPRYPLDFKERGLIVLSDAVPTPLTAQEVAQLFGIR